MAIICKECGCVNENDNARFCNDCGAKLDAQVKTPDHDVIVETKLKTQSETIKLATIDDDEEPELTREEGIKAAPVQAESDDDDDETYDSADVFVPNSKPQKNIFDAVEVDEDTEESDIINDPYYNDVLPDINNEKVVLQKGLIAKVIASVVLTGIAILVLLSVL